MLIYSRYLIILFLCFLGIQLYAQKSSFRSLQKVDSIPLFNDSHYYSFFFSEKYDSDTILGFNYPQLNLNALSRKGDFLGEITRKGSGLGLLETSTFIDVATGDSGDIYVLRQDNAYTIYIYDYQGTFKNLVRLFVTEPDYYAPVYYSNFKVSEEPDNNQVRFYLSVGSTIESPFSKEFYMNNPGILEFILDDNTFKIQETKRHLPYREKEDIQQALSNEKINWRYPYPAFDYSSNKFYVVYSFSKFLYVYNQNFGLLKKLSIKSLPELKKSYSIGFAKKRQPEFEKRRVIESRLQFENVGPWNVQVKGTKALIQLFEPQEYDRYPILTLQQAQSGESTYLNSIIIVKDLVSGQEDVYSLDKAFQGRVRLISETEFLVQGMPDRDVEEVYLYKFKLR